MYKLYMLCLLILLAVRAHTYGLSSALYSADGGLPSQITLGEGESMFLYWRPTQKSLTKCIVKTPKNEIVNLLMGSQSNFLTSSTLPFIKGYCTVRVKEMKTDLNGTWSLEASSSSKQRFNTSSQVVVLSKPVIINESYSLNESSVSTILCGRNDAVTCKLISPRGKIDIFYNGPCNKQIYSVNIFDHQGIWNCTFYLQNYIREFSAQAEVQVIEDEFKEVTVKELENEIILLCQSPKHHVRYIMFCKVTTPYGLSMYLAPGKAYSRYTYYGSKPSECGITIPKPLVPEDIGQWRCELNQHMQGSPKEIYGGYVAIGKDHKINEIQVESKNIFWTVDTSYHLLKCHVPYGIQYCWFKSPNGTIHNIADENLQTISFTYQNLGFKFGDCVFVTDDPAVYKNATGKWTCNMGIVKELVTELSASINVIYTDAPLLTEKRNVYTELGSSIHIGCKTTSGSGIDYCRFIRPDKTGLTVDPFKNNSEYSYFGDGFLHGHCGVKINKVKEQDIGSWVCALKVHGISSSNSIPYHTFIEVIKEKRSLIAVYIVAGVGSLITVLVISYFIIKKYELKIKIKDEDNSRLLQDEEDSEETHSRSNERTHSRVRYVRKRNSRPPPPPLNEESTCSYI